MFAREDIVDLGGEVRESVATHSEWLFVVGIWCRSGVRCYPPRNVLLWKESVSTELVVGFGKRRMCGFSSRGVG